MDAGFGLIERAIARGPIPGAAVAIGDRAAERQACFGVLEPDGVAVTPDTWFDMASLTKLLHTPLEQPPGSIEYSDLGFMLLGYLLERVLQKPLDVQARALFQRL